MTNFTARNGSEFTIEATSEWTTISGLTVITHRVNVYNPASGLGWNGIMSDSELQAWREWSH